MASPHHETPTQQRVWVLIKTPKRVCEEVIVGGTLNALLYAYKNNTFIIINKLQPPHPFEKAGTHNAYELWHKLFFKLGVAGLNLVGDGAKNIRIKNNEIRVTTSGARVFKYEAEKLLIFDDENVQGLPTPQKQNTDFIVLDWMTSRSCDKHPHDYLSTADPFVKEIYFYPTSRVDGHHCDKKDIVAISYLNKDQLTDFAYSDTYAKFKVMKILTALGIRGKKNGAHHYALKLEVEKREIKKTQMSLYENSGNMVFNYETPQVIDQLGKGVL